MNNSNHVTKVKIGTVVGRDTNGRPFNAPKTVSIFNAGKTEIQVRAYAAIIQALAKDSGQLDTKSKIENEEINIRETTLYVVKDINGQPTTGSKLELLEDNRSYEIGKYSLTKGRNLTKHENVAIIGVRVSMALFDPTTNDLTSNYNTNLSSKIGLSSSDLILEQDGKELLSMPISQLQLNTYTEQNFLEIGKPIVLLEDKPFNLRIHFGPGAYDDNMSLKVELVGYRTY